MAGVDHGLLEEDGRVAERALGLAHAGLDGLAQVGAVLDPAHAAAAAAGDGLDEERAASIRSAAARSSSTSVDGATDSSTGTPAALAAAIARALLPVRVSTSALGPMKVMPAAAHASARAGFSDRKP